MRLKYPYILFHAILWGGVYFVMAPNPVGLGEFDIELFDPRRRLWFVTYGLVLNAIMVYSYAHLALPRYLEKNNLGYFLFVNAAYILGFVLIESFFDLLTEASFKPTEQIMTTGKLLGWIRTNLLVSAIFMLVANLYGFTFGWFRDQQNRRYLEQAKLQAELSALKHQINPHFLFNILNGLYGLAFQNDDEPTAEGIAKLSQLMRYMLYESNDPKVPLQKEIKYIENYIDLQKLRLQQSVAIDFSVNGKIEDKQIVPMILITFVENAFKHGVSTAKPSRISIEMDVMGTDLFFTVKNTIHRLPNTSVETVGGIGLGNVRKRLDLLYKKAYRLDIDQNNGLFEVTLTIAL